jgi:tetratricopeptide (TPR) repeat protein
MSATEVGETLARARALAEQIDRPEYLVPLLYGQRQFHFVRSEHRLALAIAEQVEKIGTARRDAGMQLQGRHAHGLILCFLGEFVAARTLLEGCQGLSDPAHRAVAAGMSDDPYALMLTQLAVTLAYLGYIDQARSRLRQALSEARRLGHTSTLAVVLVHANWIDAVTRSVDLQTHVEELLALATEHGFSLFRGWAVAFRGRSFAALGRALEAVTLLAQGLAATRAAGAVLIRPMLLIWLAEAHAMLGQRDEGLNCLAEASDIIETTEERIDEAESHRLRGELLKASGDRSAAERSYRQAIAIAERQAARLFELRAAADLARLMRDQGRLGEAYELLAPTYAWFTEGFDLPDLKKAKALLDELT